MHDSVIVCRGVRVFWFGSGLKCHGVSYGEKSTFFCYITYACNWLLISVLIHCCWGLSVLFCWPLNIMFEQVFSLLGLATSTAFSYARSHDWVLGDSQWSWALRAWVHGESALYMQIRAGAHSASPTIQACQHHIGWCIEINSCQVDAYVTELLETKIVKGYGEMAR